MIKNFKNKTPQLGSGVYVSENAVVIGDVTLAEDASVWFSAVLRGDDNFIRIGKGTNIQDLVMIHTAFDAPTLVGEGCTVGHGAILHGCKIGCDTLIGMGAIILDKAEIGNNCIIGAGALVTGGTVIPDNSLVLGSPGKAVRSLKEAELEGIKENARHYIGLAKEYLV